MKKIKLIIGVILSLFLFYLAGGIIKEGLYLIFKDNLSKTLFFIITFVLLFIFIEIYFRTRPGREIFEEIFPKSRKRK